MVLVGIGCKFAVYMCGGNIMNLFLLNSPMFRSSSQSDKRTRNIVQLLYLQRKKSEFTGFISVYICNALNHK